MGVMDFAALGTTFVAPIKVRSGTSRNGMESAPVAHPL